MNNIGRTPMETRLSGADMSRRTSRSRPSEWCHAEGVLLDGGPSS